VDVLLGGRAGLGSATTAAATTFATRATASTGIRGRELGVAAATPTRAGIAGTSDQLHPVGDDLGRVFFDAILVRVLAGLQPAFDVDRASLLQVFTGDFRLPAEQHDTVPLGFFLLLATLVFPRFAGGDVQIGDGVAAGGVARFRITAEIAEQDYLVD